MRYGSRCVLWFCAAVLPLSGCHREARDSGAAAPVVSAGTLKALEGGKECANAAGHYTISFPATWTTMSGGPGTPAPRTTVLSMDQSRPGSLPPTATVSLRTLDAPTTAAEYNQASLQGLKHRNPGCEILENHLGQVNGRDALWVVWRGQVPAGGGNPLSLQEMVFGVIVDKTVYEVTCAATAESYGGLKATFEGICGSLKVTQ